MAASLDMADQQAHYARINRRMQQFLKQNPQVMKQHRIVKAEDNAYELDGKRVRLDWHGQPGRVGRLFVVDGPLRQPLPDYLAMGEANAEYDTSGVEKTSSLHHVPKDRRLTFNDDNTKYSRLDSMKVAKEQAAFREKAATYTKEGRVVPRELHRSYGRCLQQKLRSARYGGSLRQRTRDESWEPPPEGESPERPKDSAAGSRSSHGTGAAVPGGDGSQMCDWEGPGQEASPTLQTRFSRSGSGRMLPAPPPAAPRALHAPPRQAQAAPHRQAQAALAAPAGALAAGACGGAAAAVAAAAAPPPFAVPAQHGAIAYAHAFQQKSLAAAAVAAVSVGACHRSGGRGGACGGA